MTLRNAATQAEEATKLTGDAAVQQIAQSLSELASSLMREIDSLRTELEEIRIQMRR